MLVERTRRGVIRHHSQEFGRSREGLPITVWLPEDSDPKVLVMAAIHGDEAETAVVLSDALRSVERGFLKCAVVLCGNPDGLLRGTRGNAAGVDLNRNMPAKNWAPDPVCYKTDRDGPRDIELSPGTHAASEPETQALLGLLEKLNPRSVVSLHSALACIDDPNGSPLGRWIAERSGLPLHPDIGYETPGSFGSWAAERGLNLITYELEPTAPYDLKSRHTPLLIDLLAGRFEG